MKNLIKKCSALLAVGAVVLTMAMPSSLLAAQATKPREAKGNQSAFENPSMIGCNICRVEGSTTSKQCATGSGLLYWLAVSGEGPVLGKGAKAFDCAVAASITAITTTAYAIGPKVIACGTASQGNVGNLSPWEPGKGGAPARYEAGLTIKTDDTSVDAIACYRSDSGVNP